MSDSPILNWAALAVSLFNTILLIWLGLTVLLNSERRPWAIWLGGGGLLLGGAFFVSHSAILGRGLLAYDWSMVIWWTGGLIPAILLPLAWYLLVLWYAGFFGPAGRALRRRHGPWLWLLGSMLIAGLGAAGVGIFLLSNIASANPALQVIRGLFRWSLAGIPLLALGYSSYILLCLALSLDALRRPAPSARVMGSEARLRARPWLVGATSGLFTVGLFVAGTVLYTVQVTRSETFVQFYAAAGTRLLALDLLIALLIGFVILMVGQAVVAYEVFTGKILPRRELARQWQRALVLAAGYAITVSGAFALGVLTIHILLFTALLMTSFFALFSWRTYAERQRFVENLRPFVSGPRIYDSLLGADEPSLQMDVSPSFTLLCDSLVEPTFAYLAALGPLSSLLPAPLVYPAHRPVPSLPGLPALAQQLAATTATYRPLTGTDKKEGLGQAEWAIPLWSARGLLGVFLLGPRQDQGLYTEETIAIARASGERLLDMQASAELARRLMAVQRRRLSESQVLDRRVRRVLHDDILPQLHTAMLALNGSAAPEQSQAIQQQLAGVHRQIAELLHDMPAGAAPQISRAGLLETLRRTVESELGGAFEQLTWQWDSATARAVQRLDALQAEVVYYAAREAIRNAARHGRGDRPGRPLRVTVTATIGDAQLLLSIEDDGVGMGEDRPPLGHGLALHSTMMAVIGGGLAISGGETGTRVGLSVALPAAGPAEAIP